MVFSCSFEHTCIHILPTIINYALCFQLTDLTTKLKEIGEEASDGKLLLSYAYSVLLPEVSISSVSIIFFVTCIVHTLNCS